MLWAIGVTLVYLLIVGAMVELFGRVFGGWDTWFL
jgi:hypothetical protein